MLVMYLPWKYDFNRIVKQQMLLQVFQTESGQLLVIIHYPPLWKRKFVKKLIFYGAIILFARSVNASLNIYMSQIYGF